MISQKEKSTSDELFTDLSRSFESFKSELLDKMEKQQKSTENQAKDLIKELQQEISELKRRHIELEQLSKTEDDLHLLQVCEHLSFMIRHMRCKTLFMLIHFFLSPVVDVLIHLHFYTN